MTSEIAPISNQLAPDYHLRRDQNPAFVYLAGLSSETGRRTMRQALETIAALAGGGRCTIETLPWHALRFQHTAAIRARLAEIYKPATVNKMLSALRGTLKAAWELGQMSAEDYQRAVNIKSVRGETLPAGRELTPGEIAAILDACANDPGPAGVRDAAIFSLLYGGGLRRAEVVALDMMDYDPDTGRLKVHGKGRKERIVWVNNGAADALADWLATRPEDPEHDSEGGGPLFFPVLKSGRIVVGDRLSEQSIYDMLKKRAKEAGVKDFSPHDLRRTFVSDLLDAGADIATVQKMVGHANVTTTARYDRRPEEAKRKAAGLLHVPYRRRRMV